MKYLLLFCLLLISGAASAQKKAPVTHVHRQSPELQGLGQFKINKTTPAIIAELCKELNSPLEHAYSIGRLEAAKDSSVVIQVDYEDGEDYPDASTYGAACSNTQVFYLPNYRIAEIPVAELVLTFYKGLLVQIEAKGELTLSDAFEVKYGKPELKVERKAKPCIFLNTGNRITYQDETYTSRWFNGDIEASKVVSKYYDSDCEKHYISFLLIQSSKGGKALDDCNTATEKVLSAKRNAVKKKKLSGL